MIACAFLAWALGWAQAPSGQGSRAEVTHLRDAVLQQPYRESLPQPSGVPPWSWRKSSGELPPGLELDGGGTISGTPTRAGQYRFRVEARNAYTPPEIVTYNVVIVTRTPLGVRWSVPPVLEGGNINGKMEVTINSRTPLDLTVIVVAINEYGKAFALGYQHALVSTGTQSVPFGSSLPRGSYIVHADAIAENAPASAIYRGMLQTEQRLEVP